MGVKRFKYVFFILICMIVFPFTIHAECDYQRQAELSRLASNVQLTYVYTETGFSVIMTNLTKDLYAVDMYSKVIPGGEEKTFSYASGTVRFDIYTTDSSCSKEKLLTKTITLPTINSLSFRDECKQYPNFKYCQLWGNFAADDSTFDSELVKYKKERAARLATSKGNEIDVLDIILDIIKNNGFVLIFIGVVLVITGLYYFVIKKVRK